MVACEHRGRAVTRIGHHGRREILADRFEGKRLNSPNDVVVHSDGAVWFTDPTYGIDSEYEGDRAESEIGASNVYRIDPDTGAVAAVITDMVRPNGLAFSPDERSCTWPTPASPMWAGPARPTSGPTPWPPTAPLPAGGHTTFATCTNGVFDGFRVDAGGNIWTSAGDGVHCYAADGTLIGKIHLPEVVANVEFGGLKRNRLYICATTSLFAVYLNTRAATARRRARRGGCRSRGGRRPERRGRVGGVAVHRDAHTRTVYATDNSIYQVEPDGVALPRTAAEVRALVAATGRQPITARGGGTGTNGQSLTPGLMVDLKRHLNGLVSLDVAGRTAVVEPGMVTARLNSLLAPHGLHWAPHTSTLSRATVGGMISTDAAGKGSLVHGRAHRHVLALDLVLDDGTPFRAEPVPGGRGRGPGRPEPGRAGAAVAGPARPAARRGGRPRPARAGPGLQRLRHRPLPPRRPGGPGGPAVRGRGHPRDHHRRHPAPHPAAGPDPARDRRLRHLRRRPRRRRRPGRHPAHRHRVLRRDHARPRGARRRPGRCWPASSATTGARCCCSSTRATTTPTRSRYGPPWPPPAAAGSCGPPPTGPSGGRRGRCGRTPWACWPRCGCRCTRATAEATARPTAFVEDCAVPVAQMASFIAGFRATLDRFGLSYAMFGHADVGCVHVRPALDLTDPAHEALVRAVTAEVVDLVAGHGGVLWGEHGRGFRGDAAEAFLTPDTIRLMRAVKTAFDPHDRFNPGKLYRPLGAGGGAGPGGNEPGAVNPITPLDAAPLRGQVNRTVPVAVRRQLRARLLLQRQRPVLPLRRGRGHVPVVQGHRRSRPQPQRAGSDLIRAWLARQRSGMRPTSPPSSATWRPTSTSA